MTMPATTEPLDEKFLAQFNGYYRRQDAALIVHRLYNGICQSCGERIHALADMDIGHIVPRSGASFFGSMFSEIDIDNLVNLQAQHASCNRALGNGFIKSPLMVMNVLGHNERKLRHRILALAETARVDHNTIKNLAIGVSVRMSEVNQLAAGLWAVPAAPLLAQIGKILDDAGWPANLDMSDAKDVSFVLQMLHYGMAAEVGYLVRDGDTVRRMYSDGAVIERLIGDVKAMVEKLSSDGIFEPIFVFDKEVGRDGEIVLTASKGFSLVQAVHGIGYIEKLLEKGLGPDRAGCLAVPQEDFLYFKEIQKIAALDDYRASAQPESIVCEIKDLSRFCGWVEGDNIAQYESWSSYSALQRLVSRFENVFIFPESSLINLKASFERYFQQEFRNTLLEVECLRENLDAARPQQADLFSERAAA